MGWGLCTIAGVAGKGEVLEVVPRYLITGRRIAGASFGGAKGRDRVPELVDLYLKGDLDLEAFVTQPPHMGGGNTPPPPAEPITIRRATDDDARALDRLARLDSQRLPRGPHLVALAADRPVAAVSLRDGRWVADPFLLTDDVVDLLRERVGHLTGRPLPKRGVPALGLLRGLFPAAPRRA